MDLTAKSVTNGSTSGLTYSYFLDANQREYMPTPKVVTNSGVYYIKAVNNTGCSEMKPVSVAIKNPPDIKITNPPPVCFPNTVDLTLPSITAGSQAGLTLTYWKDAGATNGLVNPKEINTNGTYYINGSFAAGCSKTVPVTATIGTLPTVLINNPSNCGKVDISASSVTTGSDAGLTYSYWEDAGASVSLPSSNTVTSTGEYFIKGTTSLGCSVLKPVQATVNAFPAFTVASPISVTYPATADLTSSISPRSISNYTYWNDPQLTRLVARPENINFNGTFYIKAKNEFGCIVSKPVTVIINAPPEPKITAPSAFSPNNDGVNDLFKISVKGEVDVKNIKIFSRWGQLIFESKTIRDYWDGRTKGTPLPVGTYYWVFEGVDTYKERKVITSGSITLIR